LKVKGTVQHNVKDLFAGTLRLIKIWAYHRDIYGQASGYLPGGGFATILATFIHEGLISGVLEVDIYNPADKSYSHQCMEIVRFFFKRAVNWSWPAVLSLPAINLRNEDEKELVISARIKVDYVEANYARSTAVSTIDATLGEFKQALSNLNLSASSLEAFELVLRKRLTQDFISMHKNLVYFEAFARDDIPNYPLFLFPDIKAWGSTKVLSSLVFLEQRISSLQLVSLRLRPKATRLKKKRVFYWLLGVNRTIDQSKSVKVYFAKLLEDDSGHSKFGMKIEVLNTESTIQRFALNEQTEDIPSSQLIRNETKVIPQKIIRPTLHSVKSIYLIIFAVRVMNKGKDKNEIIHWDDEVSRTRVTEANIIIMRGVPVRI